MKITIGFSKSTKKLSVLSKLIRLWDSTGYSHVYFEFKSTKYDVDMIYQSSSTMLNYMSKEVFLTHNEIVYEIHLNIYQDQYNKLMKNCMKSAGLGYGIMQVIGIPVARFLNLKKNPFSNKHKYHCSEWVAEQLEFLGFKFDKPLDLVTPKDIYLILYCFQS